MAFNAMKSMFPGDGASHENLVAGFSSESLDIFYWELSQTVQQIELSVFPVSVFSSGNLHQVFSEKLL